MYEGKVRTKVTGLLQGAIAPIFGLVMLGALFWFIIKTSKWFLMPIVTMTSHLSPSWEELVTIFKDDYKVNVRFIEKEIEIGEELPL